MSKDERLEDLMKCIEPLEDANKTILKPLCRYLADWECQLEELAKMPQIRIDPKNSSRQKMTEASKQYKIVSQSYMNGIRILIGALKNQKENDTNALLEKLEKFM